MASQAVFGDFTTANGTDVFSVPNAGDTIFVGVDGSVAALAGGSAIRFFTDTAGYIAGELYANNYRTIVGNASVSDVVLEIAETGRVVSKTFAAINWGGADSTIVNRGTITGLENSTEAVVSIPSGGNLVENYGRIASIGYDAISMEESGIVGNTVRNEGFIRGDIFLGDAADVFAGSKGKVEGEIFGEGGDDSIRAGTGNDRIHGGDGIDSLAGNTGADLFVFQSVTNSPDVNNGRDILTDFSRKQHDRIDLSGIDANANLGGDQAFKLAKGSQFNEKARELIDFIADNGFHFVKGDVDGDGSADFAIRLLSGTRLHDADFIL